MVAACISTQCILIFVPFLIWHIAYDFAAQSQRTAKNKMEKKKLNRLFNIFHSFSGSFLHSTSVLRCSSVAHSVNCAHMHNIYIPHQLVINSKPNWKRFLCSTLLHRRQWLQNGQNAKRENLYWSRSFRLQLKQLLLFWVIFFCFFHVRRTFLLARWQCCLAHDHQQ